MSVAQQLARMQGGSGATPATPSPVPPSGAALDAAVQVLRDFIEYFDMPPAGLPLECDADDVAAMRTVLTALSQSRAQAEGQAEYAITLQRMIEAICAGEIPDALAAQSPYHAQLAREHLAQSRADSAGNEQRLKEITTVCLHTGRNVSMLKQGLAYERIYDLAARRADHA